MADRRSAAASLPTAAAPPVTLLGLYQVLLGLALLITPHWFNNPVYESWGGQYGPIGLAFLLAGAGLLWVALLPVRRTAVVLAAYLLAMVNFGSMALMFGRSGAVQASAVYGVLALGTLLLGGLNLGRGWFSSAACRTFRPQGTVVHVIALVTGALLLWRPGAASGA